MKVLIFFLLIIFIVPVLAQTKQTKTKHLPIILKRPDFQIYNPSLRRSVRAKLNDTSTIVYVLSDYKGALIFSVFNSKEELIQSGQYSNALDVFKRYTYTYYGLSGGFEIHVQPYYEPLPNGIWIWYVNNKILKKEKYQQGQQIE